MLCMATRDTAKVEITKLERRDGQLMADLLVVTKTGYYLPSGVGFRRMFIEVLALDKAGNEIWASGKTNDLGVLLDCQLEADGRQQSCAHLPGEAGGGQAYQPHRERITGSDQVQIYQEVIADCAASSRPAFCDAATT